MPLPLPGDRAASTTRRNRNRVRRAGPQLSGRGFVPVLHAHHSAPITSERDEHDPRRCGVTVTGSHRGRTAASRIVEAEADESPAPCDSETLETQMDVVRPMVEVA